MKFSAKAERRAKRVNAQFVSISTGRDFQPEQFMINLCTSSDLIQLDARRWHPALARFAWWLRTKSNIQTPLSMLSTMEFSKPWIKPSSRQCENSQSPCSFYVQQFGHVWPGPWNLSSSIYIGFVLRLTDAQWQIRIDQSNDLLRLLESAQANDWQSFMTLDEFCFYLLTSHKKIWVQAGQQLFERVKHMIWQATH
jgi:hypothetical protein